MAYASIGLVILFLATVAGALVTGLLAPSGPRTLAEKELAVSGEAVRQGSTAPGDWGRYVAALVDAGQYGRARSVLQDARGSIDDSGTAEIPLGEARLAAAQGQHESAVEHAEEAMEVLDADLEVRLASGGLIADRARISGQHNNYWVAALIAAYSYGELESWEEAVEKFDLYIDRNPGAADVLVDRGHAKAELGDTAGAEADFRAALRFIPDSEEALEGLEQIGVTP
jgi:tetratricopeptide (TPR) repeat protein